jgi:hypothetical protein
MQQEPDLITSIDHLCRVISTTKRDLLTLFVEADQQELWRDEGARDMAHWV